VLRAERREVRNAQKSTESIVSRAVARVGRNHAAEKGEKCCRRTLSSIKKYRRSGGRKRGICAQQTGVFGNIKDSCGGKSGATLMKRYTRTLRGEKLKL